MRANGRSRLSPGRARRADSLGVASECLKNPYAACVRSASATRADAACKRTEPEERACASTDRLWFWLAASVIGALLLVLTQLRDILLPFVAGIAIAYFLNPVADPDAGGRGLSRTLGPRC